MRAVEFLRISDNKGHSFCQVRLGVFSFLLCHPPELWRLQSAWGEIEILNPELKQGEEGEEGGGGGRSGRRRRERTAVYTESAVKTLIVLSSLMLRFFLVSYEATGWHFVAHEALKFQTVIED